METINKKIISLEKRIEDIELTLQNNILKNISEKLKVHDEMFVELANNFKDFTFNVFQNANSTKEYSDHILSLYESLTNVNKNITSIYEDLTSIYNALNELEKDKK